MYCSKLVDFLKIFLVYLISQIFISTLYYYFIFKKDVLYSLLVPMPLAFFISFIYFMFINHVCNEDD